ncbi:MAG: hypothetical protein ABIU06_00955 [Anaerolineales bacterium]
MDNKEKLSGSQNNGGTGVTPADKPVSTAPKGELSAKKEVKTKRRKARSKQGIKLNVLIPLIVAITPIVIALFTFPPFIAWFQPDPTAISTVISSPTLFISATPTVSITDTVIPVITASITYTPTISVTSTDIPITVTPSAKMEVYLYADKTSGTRPLRIKFDARDSYLREPNGTKFPCRGGPCDYTWKVYANGTQLGKSVTDAGGTFEYSFGARGVYLVTVDICRGRDKLDCGGAGIQIEVTR